MLLLTIKIHVKFYAYLAVMEFPISNTLCLALTAWLLQGSIVTTILTVSCAQVSMLHSSLITFYEEIKRARWNDKWTAVLKICI